MCLSFVTLILVAGSVIQIHAAKCLFYPVGKLPSGCSVGNLTLINSNYRPLINENLCNSTVDSSLVQAKPQQIHFNHLTNQPAPRYLLTAVDLTSKELLWMISNLTLNGLSIIPEYNPKIQMIMQYRSPSMSVASYRHVVEILVFEEKPVTFSSSYFNYPELIRPPFNLSVWIEKQRNCGITICGPVAGGSIVVHQQYQASTSYPNSPNQNSAHPNYPNSPNQNSAHPNYPSYNQQSKSKKNYAFHNSPDRSIMLLSVITYIILLSMRNVLD